MLKARIKEITDTHVHYGYRRVHVMLRREGHMDIVKRVYRLYRAEGLSLRLKRPKRNRAAQWRQPKQLATANSRQTRQRQGVHLQSHGQVGL